MTQPTKRIIGLTFDLHDGMTCYRPSTVHELSEFPIAAVSDETKENGQSNECVKSRFMIVSQGEIHCLAFRR